MRCVYGGRRGRRHALPRHHAPRVAQVPAGGPAPRVPVPRGNQITVQCRIPGHLALEDVHLAIAVRDAKTNRTMFDKSYKGLPSYTPDFTISTNGWPVGSYPVDMVFSAKGAKPVRHSLDYERVPLPEWWNNEIGKELGVPYPWTAMKTANDTIYATGREYRFDGKLLPAQIMTQNRPMLRSPARLVVKTAAGEIARHGGDKVIGPVDQGHGPSRGGGAHGGWARVHDPESDVVGVRRPGLVPNDIGAARQADGFEDGRGVSVDA